ncbi:MAG: hypothetical protein JWM80_2875 [Cyanobacteria bacterium RYN_339]|nr:hypothetical protein [Cyanobacteria bacterium RYN_339]
MRTTLALLASLSMLAAPAFAAAPVKDDTVGIDLASKDLDKHGSQRYGHAEVTQAQVIQGKKDLPKDQLSLYEKVYAALAARKQSQEQLAALVAAHRLKYADAQRHTVLDNLATIANGKIGHGIPKDTLLADVVADITRPSTVAQAHHSSCTATSIQAQLARQNPAEYVRLVAGLATAGKVTLRNGKMTLSDKNYLPSKDRTSSSNLMQAAIMTAESEVEGGRYDNANDCSYDKQGRKYVGEYNVHVIAVENAMLSGKFENMGVNAGNRDAAMAILKHASAKFPVLASVKMKSGGGHEIQVVGYDTHKSIVTIRNPWGEIVNFPAKPFRQALTGINYEVGE